MLTLQLLAVLYIIGAFITLSVLIRLIFALLPEEYFKRFFVHTVGAVFFLSAVGCVLVFIVGSIWWLGWV